MMLGKSISLKDMESVVRSHSNVFGPVLHIRFAFNECDLLPQSDVLHLIYFLTILASKENPLKSGRQNMFT